MYWAAHPFLTTFHFWCHLWYRTIFISKIKLPWAEWKQKRRSFAKVALSGLPIERQWIVACLSGRVLMTDGRTVQLRDASSLTPPHSCWKISPPTTTVTRPGLLCDPCDLFHAAFLREEYSACAACGSNFRRGTELATTQLDILVQTPNVRPRPC